MARKVDGAECSYPEIVFGRGLWVIFSIAELLSIFCSKQPLGFIIAAGGRSGVNFYVTTELCNLYNSLFGVTFTFLYHIFVSKFPKFRCHGNKGRLGVNFYCTD